jgi:hypothetical protein
MITSDFRCNDLNENYLGLLKGTIPTFAWKACEMSHNPQRAVRSAASTCSIHTTELQLQKPSPYLTGDTIILRYRAQQANAV